MSEDEIRKRVQHLFEECGGAERLGPTSLANEIRCAAERWMFQTIENGRLAKQPDWDAIIEKFRGPGRPARNEWRNDFILVAIANLRYSDLMASVNVRTAARIVAEVLTEAGIATSASAAEQAYRTELRRALAEGGHKE